MFRRAGDSPGPQVTLIVDGVAVEADALETVAGVLLRVAPHVARRSVGGRPRAPYCLAGACFDCVALVDGRPVQTCLVAVRDGMDVRRQLGPPDLAAAPDVAAPPGRAAPADVAASAGSRPSSRQPGTTSTPEVAEPGA